LLFLLAPAIALAEEPTRVEVTKDNSIVLLSGEIKLNAGSSGQIRIKGNQHLVAMMFDAAALHYLTPGDSPGANYSGDSPGAKYFAVKSATLVACKGDAMIDGLTISTLQADWDEMKSNGLTAGLPGVEGWGYAGARFPAVTGGNAFSLFCQAPSTVKDGAYHWPVHPDLVNALAVGAAYGLTLHEWSADYSRNPTIFSREQSGKKPYLLVTFGEADPDPEPPTDLKVTGPDPTAVCLALRAPKNGFAYEVTVNGAALPRWNTPFVRPGEAQVIPIRDVPLKAGDPLAVSVVTVSRAGKRSAPATLGTTVPAPKAMFISPPVNHRMFISPPVNHRGLSTAAAAPGAARDAGNLAVIPLEDKYDAAGKAVGNLPADYLVRNPLFDGQSVRLTAARGEVVGFQALVKGTGKVSVKCELPGLRTEVYRAVYVQAEKGRRVPDPLVPVAADEEIALSADEATPVCVYVFVPFDLLTPGDSPGANYIKERAVEGALALSDGRKVPVSVAVRRFEIPREASFLCEMNGYGLPDKASEFYRLQEIAYDHRAHVNLLAYGHSSTAPGSAKSRMNMLMDISFSGEPKATAAVEPATRRMDDKRYNDIAPGAKRGSWDDFTAVFGPYLSGTCFKNGHRGPVPAPGFYLTFHESWPLKCREFFDGNPDACEAFKAKPVYAETFVNIMGDFLALARRQGWTRTGFQFYCNNKGTLKDASKAPWILDEPASYWDYRALAYYGDLARQGRRGDGGRPPAFRYRIDISRPEFDRGQLAGKADLWVTASGAFHEYHRLVTDRAEQTGERLWVYGTTNKVEETNRTVEAWVLDAYRGGAWGVVPWQTIDSKGAAMTKADQLGLFIFTKTDAGRPVIRHSIRLAAYLAAEQTVEYLELARKKHNLTPGQVQAFIDHYLNLSGTVRSAYAEDAGTPEYGKVTPEAFRQLREAAAMMIEKP
jgi:hypothetical protein